MIDYLKQYVEEIYSDSDFNIIKEKHNYHCMQITKESLFFREIFEKYYKGSDKIIKAFWMPNNKWIGIKINYPSVRVLFNYGDSAK